MNEDFSNYNLFFRERFKLFVMRFRPMPESFIGKDAYNLSRIAKFINSEYSFQDTTQSDRTKPSCYHLTERYQRYRVWKRREFYQTIWVPLLVAIVSGVAASLLTLLVASK